MTALPAARRPNPAGAAARPGNRAGVDALTVGRTSDAAGPRSAHSPSFREPLNVGLCSVEPDIPVSACRFRQISRNDHPQPESHPNPVIEPLGTSASHAYDDLTSAADDLSCNSRNALRPPSRRANPRSIRPNPFPHLPTRRLSTRPQNRLGHARTAMNNTVIPPFRLEEPGPRTTFFIPFSTRDLRRASLRLLAQPAAYDRHDIRMDQVPASDRNPGSVQRLRIVALVEVAYLRPITRQRERIGEPMAALRRRTTRSRGLRGVLACPRSCRTYVAPVPSGIKRTAAGRSPPNSASNGSPPYRIPPPRPPDTTVTSTPRHRSIGFTVLPLNRRCLPGALRGG